MNVMIRNIRSRKVLALAALTAVLCAGVLFGLSILPHAHEGEAHHEPGSGCAVHQFSLSHLDFAVAAAIFLVISEAFRFLVRGPGPIVFNAPTFSRNLRGPPVSF